MRVRGTYSIQEIRDILDKYNFCYCDNYDYFRDEDEVRTIFILYLCDKDLDGNCCNCVDGTTFKLVPAQNDKSEPWEPKRYYLFDVDQDKYRLLSSIIDGHEKDFYWMEHYREELREELEEELRGDQNEGC